VRRYFRFQTYMQFKKKHVASSKLPEVVGFRVRQSNVPVLQRVLENPNPNCDGVRSYIITNKQRNSPGPHRSKPLIPERDPIYKMPGFKNVPIGETPPPRIIPNRRVTQYACITPQGNIRHPCYKTTHQMY
jgi:hypothetical protein